MSELWKAQNAFIALYAQDVQEFPGCYKAHVRAAPHTAALGLVEHLDLDEVKQMTRDLRAEIRSVRKALQ